MNERDLSGLSQAELWGRCGFCRRPAGELCDEDPCARRPGGHPVKVEPKICIACGRDIKGRAVALRPPDPKYALCPPCAQPPTSDDA